MVQKIKEETFFEDYNNFMNEDRYISKKDMKDFFKAHYKLINGINKGIKTDENIKKVKRIISYSEDSRILHNRLFMVHNLKKEKVYFDKLSKQIGPNIYLDEEQRTAILTEEDYSIILAGAGSGKTTTITGKVKYLVDRLDVDPKEIVVISFTNQAVDELKKRINDGFGLNVKICTFHKFGVEILNNNSKHKLKVLTNSYDIIKKYFDNELAKDKDALKQFMNYFAFDLNESSLKFDKIDDFLKYSTNNYDSLKGSISKGLKMDCQEEVIIANYLYLNNIKYEYKKRYDGGSKLNLYTPDFTLYYNNKVYYLEYFNIKNVGYDSKYSFKNNRKYRNKIKKRRKFFNFYNDDLIEIYSDYFDNKTIIQHLKEELEKRNISLKDNYKETYKLLIQSKSSSYFNFINFCVNFIKKYRMYGGISFEKLKIKSKRNKRNRMFLELIEKVYNYYENYLRENNYIDFEDMINQSYHLLKTSEKLELNYKYIIIDEYQDISMQRFNLTKIISDICGAKIIAVGDDWQSIFAFSGSNISLFTKFKELMGYAEELKISNTYRNSQELIDVAGNFIMQNKLQMKKQLKSNKHLDKPIKLIPYNDNFDEVLNKCIKDIVKRFGEEKNILIIGRYNFDKQKLVKSNYFKEVNGEIKSVIYSKLKITFLTAHSSKGLTFDNVIIINNEDSIYGFPSKVKDDPILKMLNYNVDKYDYAEERRLFYVALTRTKNFTYILYPNYNPSIFVNEISKSKDVEIFKIKKCNNFCPKCHFKLVKSYDLNYGVDIYTCTNEKELCGFKTTNLEYKKEAMVCPKCLNGLLLIKKNKHNKYFMGCSNYFKNKCDFRKNI